MKGSLKSLSNILLLQWLCFLIWGDITPPLRMTIDFLLYSSLLNCHIESGVCETSSSSRSLNKILSSGITYREGLESAIATVYGWKFTRCAGLLLEYQLPIIQLQQEVGYLVTTCQRWKYKFPFYLCWRVRRWAIGFSVMLCWIKMVIILKCSLFWSVGQRASYYWYFCLWSPVFPEC